MPALSFKLGFLDARLNASKKQTTRKPTGRIKVGDVVNVYLEQRDWNYPAVPNYLNAYWAVIRWAGWDEQYFEPKTRM